MLPLLLLPRQSAFRCINFSARGDDRSDLADCLQPGPELAQLAFGDGGHRPATFERISSTQRAVESNLMAATS